VLCSVCEVSTSRAVVTDHLEDPTLLRRAVATVEELLETVGQAGSLRPP
jgi:hypothetical protein